MGKSNEKEKKKGGIRKYFRDLRSELKKVTWPTKKQVANNTGIVIATMCLTGLFLAGIDTGLGWLFNVLVHLGS
ncbi:MAG: preprotein translocase subunit SecE [Oscillospiraceae bacterium]|nr:preprotein translocase subunit SecE [Oscillospiraceae bacterium]